MNFALCTICPDAKQRQHLALVRPTWEAYARRHHLPFLVIENPPIPEHFYWGKYFLLEMAELSAYDGVAVLDNDILINASAPHLAEGWNPEKVGMADEREQFGWSRAYVENYYAHYDLTVPPSIGEPRVLNGGVLIYGRQHLSPFRAIYEGWLQWRRKAGSSRSWSEQFRFANDQPHIGLALQQDNLAQNLEMKFNRLWWSWWQDHGRRSEFPFKVYAKSLKLSAPWLPESISRAWARPGIRQIERALSENHFLHFAGSKSPLHLWKFRAPAGQGPTRGISATSG